jgi:hypothetical protein
MVQLTAEQQVFIVIYNAACYINLSSFNTSLCIKFTYACQAFMHLWVQQSAEAFKF